MYKSIIKIFKALSCLNSSKSLNLNCYNSYDHQSCLNLFRFNMIWIVTIHVILKHVWTCWNMSELVQIQYDTNCYDSYNSQTCLNMLKHVWNCSGSIWYELIQFLNMSRLKMKTCRNTLNLSKWHMKCYSLKTKLFLGSLRASRAIKNQWNYRFPKFFRESIDSLKNQGVI